LTENNLLTSIRSLRTPVRNDLFEHSSNVNETFIRFYVNRIDPNRTEVTYVFCCGFFSPPTWPDFDFNVLPYKKNHTIFKPIVDRSVIAYTRFFRIYANSWYLGRCFCSFVHVWSIRRFTYEKRTCTTAVVLIRFGRRIRARRTVSQQKENAFIYIYDGMVIGGQEQKNEKRPFRIIIWIKDVRDKTFSRRDGFRRFPRRKSLVPKTFSVWSHREITVCLIFSVYTKTLNIMIRDRSLEKLKQLRAAHKQRFITTAKFLFRKTIVFFSRRKK